MFRKLHAAELSLTLVLFCLCRDDAAGNCIGGVGVQCGCPMLIGLPHSDNGTVATTGPVPLKL